MVWEKTHLVLVPPILQVLSRVFQELILLLSLVKIIQDGFFKVEEVRLDLGDSDVPMWVAQVVLPSGGVLTIWKTTE